jgi:preprotein translocase subunit SecA
MEWLKTPPDVPIESKAVTRSIRSAQTQVEQQNFEIRKDVLKYDDVLNRQRKVVYAERRRVLEGADLHEQIRQMIDEVVEGYVAGATSEGFSEEWDLDKLWTALQALYHPKLTVPEAVEEAGGEQGMSAESLAEVIQANAQASYDEREEELTPDIMRELERRVVLAVLDRKWREHLYEMDYLREGIGLRAWAQRDPLVEYQREGFDMFNAMMEGIKEESVGNLFNLQVEVQENPIVEEAAGSAPLTAPGGLALGAPAVQPANGTGTAGAGSPRNQPPRNRTGSRSRRANGQGGNGPAGGGPAGGGPSGGGQASGGQASSGRGAHAAQAGDAAPPVVAPGLQRPQRPARLQYSAPSADQPGQVEQHATTSAEGDQFSRVGRNDLCPCGSGRKYKRCHGDPRNRAGA